MLLFSNPDPTNLPHMSLSSRKPFSSFLKNSHLIIVQEPSLMKRAQMTENKQRRRCVCVRKANTSHADVTSNTKGMRTSSLFHKLALLLHKRATAVSASHLYLHASSSCRSTGVHGLNVTGLAASDHKAPAHSITNNLGAKRQEKKKKKKLR